MRPSAAQFWHLHDSYSTVRCASFVFSIDVETFHLGVRLHVSCSRRAMDCVSSLVMVLNSLISMASVFCTASHQRVHRAGRVTLQLCGRVFLPGGRKQRRVPEHFLRELFLSLFLHLHCLAVALKHVCQASVQPLQTVTNRCVLHLRLLCSRTPLDWRPAVSALMLHVDGPPGFCKTLRRCSRYARTNCILRTWPRYPRFSFRQ